MTTSARIGLIDYGSGNLRSVAKALQFVGAEVRHIVSGPIPDGLEALVLPGVGSFFSQFGSGW
jgi:glutamine amidotransferase